MSKISDPRQLRMSDYTYDLPDDRIAKFPLQQRDAAKLLVYDQDRLCDDQFYNLPNYLPGNSILVLNDAKVIRARLRFRKSSGGLIEIFCLAPNAQYRDITEAMSQRGSVSWQCLVGGAARWKSGTELTLDLPGIQVRAILQGRSGSEFAIRFSWTPADFSFAEILEACGEMPLPPYLKRAADAGDSSSYQTLFAAKEGSVAAPTASLHFTENLLESLSASGVEMAKLTLHVGAGTFLPVKSETIGGHEMHHEWIEISGSLIKSLLESDDKPVIAAGTTALRTLESLYHIGCKLIARPDLSDEALRVDQWMPYETRQLIERSAALEAVLAWMKRRERSSFITKTGILIAPGYEFKMTDGLITNFHQPQSTLLLLIAAFIGDDWRRVYDYALQHDFRFLSYGDGSLLWRNRIIS